MNSLHEVHHAGEAVLSEANGNRSREAVIIASGAGIIEPGQVLGRIKKTGEYASSGIASVTGFEGAEKACAIALHGCDASKEAVKVTALVRDAELVKLELLFDITVDDDAKKATKFAELEAVGLIVR